MKRKLLSVALCVAMTATLLAGCGNNGGSQNGGNEGNGNNAASTESSNTPAASDETVALRVGRQRKTRI